MLPDHLVRGVRPEEQFELDPDGVIIANLRAAIEIVLKADL